MSKVIRSSASPDEYAQWQAPIMEELGILNSEAGAPKGPMTAEQLEKIQRQAYQEAYQAGMKKGFQEGLTKGTEQAQQAVHAVQSILSCLAKPKSQLDESVQQQLVRLTMIITQQLFRREIKLEPGEIIGVVREAIDALPLAGDIVQLVLHPEDAVLVADVLKTKDGNSHWSLVEDPSVSRGGCYVNTEFSHIDATVEKRLVSIITDMLGGERSVDIGDAKK